MKKICVFYTIVVSIFFLAGCDRQITHQNQEKMTNRTTTKVVQYGERAVHERMLNAQGVMIDFDFIFPQLTGDYAGLPQINAYYVQKEKEYFAQKDADYLSADSMSGDEFHLYVYYHEAAILGDVISIYGDEDSFTGGATNAMILHGDVFDLHTGKKLTLDDIFSVDAHTYLTFIHDAVIEEIKKETMDGKNGSGRYSFGDDQFSLGSIDSPKGREVIQTFDPKDFFLTDNGLIVFYPKYSLGPGASGVFMYEIPFASMTDMVEIKMHKGENTPK